MPTNPSSPVMIGGRGRLAIRLDLIPPRMLNDFRGRRHPRARFRRGRHRPAGCRPHPRRRRSAPQRCAAAPAGTGRRRTGPQGNELAFGHQWSSPRTWFLDLDHEEFDSFTPETPQEEGSWNTKGGRTLPSQHNDLVPRFICWPDSRLNGRKTRYGKSRRRQAPIRAKVAGLGTALTRQAHRRG